MTIKTAGLVGGGGAVRLDVDTNYPSSLGTSGASYTSVLGIDASSSLTTLLSLTGKYYISYISINGVASENITIKLTVDGEVIWNDTYANTLAVIALYDADGVGRGSSDLPFMCDSSFLLEMQTTADTSIQLIYKVRKIK